MIQGKKFEKARKTAKEWLAKMTLTEKIGQLSQFGTSIYSDDENTYSDHFAEGKVGSYLTIKGAEKTNQVQKELLSKTRLPIPAVFADDVIHGYRTTMPTPLAQSCTWDPAIVEDCGSVQAKEAYRDGIRWTFTPMIDIARDPRWGRIMEGFGEDPFLCSRLTEAAVSGIQGKEIGEKDKLLSCLKHFVAYGACIGGRDYNSVDICEQTLRDVYLPSFKAGVDAGAATLMSAFNDINGVPATANRHTLHDILRKEWGFNGFVVSDAGAINELLNHGFASDPKHAAELAFTAGVDMNMAGDLYNDMLPVLLEEGKVTMEQIDDAVVRILTLKIMLGLMDEPYTEEEDNSRECYFSPEHRAVSREAGKHAIVLLENDGVLPLKKNQKIALVGPLMDNKEHVLGGWACLDDPSKTVSILEGMIEAFGEEQIIAAKGCDIEGDNREGFAEAVAAAEKADVIVAVMGEHRSMSGEAMNRSDIRLPGIQEEFIHTLAQTGKPIVLLASSGRPLVLTNVREKANAMLMMWQLGTETGHAVADVLTGAHNPSGHLTATMPWSVGQIPINYSHFNTGRPALNVCWFESKYMDAPIDPLYPFGYGKSYTEFAYSNAKLDKESISMNETLTVTVDVTNTGDVAGHDVVQLYVRDMVGSRVRPIRELKGFEKVWLEAKETKTLTFTISPADLAFTNNEMQTVTEPGDFQIFVAHHALDSDICLPFCITC